MCYMVNVSEQTGKRFFIKDEELNYYVGVKIQKSKRQVNLYMKYLKWLLTYLLFVTACIIKMYMPTKLHVNWVE